MPAPLEPKTTTVTVDSAAEQAGRLLGAVLGDGMTASHVGGHFTCSEAENIAGALVKLGQLDAAATFLSGHAEGDDDPDDDPDHLHIADTDSWDEQMSRALEYLTL